MAKNYSEKDIKKLVDDGIGDLNKEVMQNFMRVSGLHTEETLEIPDSFDDGNVDPVFTYIIIDKSGSMQRCAKSVIEHHPTMIDVFRVSAVTRHNAHYISQILFSTTPERLHGPKILATEPGEDEVVILNVENYKPVGATALYDTLHTVMEEILVVLKKCYDEGSRPTMTIAIITDGEDNSSKVNPSVLKALIKELKDKKYLRTSVVVGLFGDKDGLNEEKLEKIKETIGFDESLACDQADPKAIRKIFIMASESVVAFNKK